VLQCVLQCVLLLVMFLRSPPSPTSLLFRRSVLQSVAACIAV